MQPAQLLACAFMSFNLQALGQFVMSSDGQALLTGTGLKPMVVGTTSVVATAAT